MLLLILEARKVLMQNGSCDTCLIKVVRCGRMLTLLVIDNAQASAQKAKIKSLIAGNQTLDLCD